MRLPPMVVVERTGRTLTAVYCHRIELRLPDGRTTRHTAGQQKTSLRIA